jgi:site-specific DNA-methyltransferase (adenine-specific)
MKTKIGRNMLFHGDCLEILPTFPRNCVDAVITDPPYTVSTNAANGGRRQNNELGPHQADATVKTVGDLSLIEYTFRGWFSEILRVLKPTGRIFVFCNATNYPILMRAAYGRFAYSKLIVWDKTYFGTGGEFRPQHELIFYARCGKARSITKYKDQSDVLRCKPVPPQKRIHAAQKPVALLETLLRYCDSVVLDTFMGSGSILEACTRTGHAGIGIEIERQFYDVAVQRINSVVQAKREQAAS